MGLRGPRARYSRTIAVISAATPVRIPGKLLQKARKAFDEDLLGLVSFPFFIGLGVTSNHEVDRNDTRLVERKNVRCCSLTPRIKLNCISSCKDVVRRLLLKT